MINGMTYPDPAQEATPIPTAAALSEMKLEEMFDRWPETAAVFNRRQMGCVGCAVASFYTVSDAAEVYGLDAKAFVEELAKVIGAGEASDLVVDEQTDTRLK
jgi:hybrid cluster-associated redox disulfide protein